MHHAMRRQFHATIFAIPLLCLGVGLKAQDNGVADKATFEEASLLMEEKLYGQAALEWKALLANDPAALYIYIAHPQRRALAVPQARVAQRPHHRRQPLG